jgi:hypothetical protein
MLRFKGVKNEIPPAPDIDNHNYGGRLRLREFP